MRLLRCNACGLRVSTRWLLLAMPWSNYTCSRCGSVFAGTFVRSAVTSVLVFILGYVLLQVIKGRMSAVVLVPALGVTAAAFLVDLPRQLRTVDRRGHSDAS